jgi:predicted ATP-grasp superfamily ATP-dependent carboligase
LTDEADVRSLGRNLVGSLKITGVLKADFKRAPDGRLYLLELNPRFNLWHHLGAVAGVNLPALVHADLCGYPRPPVAEVTGDARWCNVRKDFMAARRSGLPLRAWLRWVLAADVKVHFALDDPGPGAVEAKRWLRMARRRAEAGIGALRR